MTKRQAEIEKRAKVIAKAVRRYQGVRVSWNGESVVMRSLWLFIAKREFCREEKMGKEFSGLVKRLRIGSYYRTSGMVNESPDCVRLNLDMTIREWKALSGISRTELSIGRF